ncbi:MAG: class II aldolase/adducin family protein [Spirochaetaceae bacterium]|jgi:L-fuculose-phosphate aldolase|nr:class II aldolase/adducin family protein [Spirochaetaceae bacterium]
MKYELEKKELALFMRRLYEKDLTTCSGGNISMKVSEDTIVITPSSLDKSNLTFHDIAIVTLEGENLTKYLKISIETEMHLSIYRERKDIQAIVHAHPLHGTMFTASEKHLRTDLIAEARLLLGEPVFAPYALMGTEKLAKIAGNSFRNSKTRIVLLENHGVITVGKSLFRAYDRMEVLESAAKMTYMGELLGGVKGLTSERIKEIDELTLD